MEADMNAFVTPGEAKVVVRRNESFFSLLHVINILFESLLLFFCSREDLELDEMYCHDTFTVGTGAVVSVVALASGEAETSMVALLSLCAYHCLVFFAHLKRYLNEGVAPHYGKQVSVISVVNLVLLLQSLYFVVVVKRLVKWDFCVGLFAALLVLISPPPPQKQVALLMILVKLVPSALLALRVWTESKLPRKATLLIVAGLLILGLAHVAMELNVVLALALVALARALHTIALTLDCREILLTTKLMPIAAYATSFYIAALLPGIQKSTSFSSPGIMALALFAYTMLSAAFVWRASVLPEHSGLLFAVGAIALVLSDSLFALDALATPIPNAQYPVLALYYLGQGLLAKATLAEEKEQVPANKDKGE